MAHRDFAVRRSTNNKKKNKGNNKNILIGTALAVVLGFGVGLYFLKHKTDEQVVQPIITSPEKTQPKSVLPNRPEEVWSYIKALETRTVPVDDKPASIEKNMRLTEEQRQVLMQMEKEQKEAEKAKQLAEQKRAEEKAKVELAATTSTGKTENVKSSDSTKRAEQAKTDTTKKAETAKIETAKKVEPNKTADNTNTTGGKKFGLQCGAFKNRAQAENLQVRLAMAGLNAQVVVNAEWNRVRVSGFANRDAAVQAQSKAKSVADCVVIGL